MSRTQSISSGHPLCKGTFRGIATGGSKETVKMDIGESKGTVWIKAMGICHTCVGNITEIIASNLGRSLLQEPRITQMLVMHSLFLRRQQCLCQANHHPLPMMRSSWRSTWMPSGSVTGSQFKIWLEGFEGNNDTWEDTNDIDSGNRPQVLEKGDDDFDLEEDFYCRHSDAPR